MNAHPHNSYSATSELSTFCRAFAAVMPALIISYSALIDPLINFNLAAGFQYGGIEVGYEQKSKVLTKIAMPLFLGLAIVTALFARPVVPRQLRGVVLPGGLFLAFACVSALWARAPVTTLTLAAYQAILYGSLLIFVAVANDPRRVVRYILITFALVVAANLAALLLHPPAPNGHQGIYSFKNTLGAAGGCALMFGLFNVFDEQLRWRAISWFTVLGAIVLTVASDSKTAVGLALIAPAGAATIWVMARALGVGPTFAAALIAALCLTGTITICLMLGIGFDDLLLATYGDATFTGRTEIWSFVYGHIENAPLIGNGFRGFWSLGAASPKHGSEIEFIRTIGSAHNGYLDVTLDLGLVGLMLLLAVIFMAFQIVTNAGGRPTHRSLLYLSVFLFAVGRNMMESVILWSSFFDNLSFLLVSFLACFPEEVRLARSQMRSPVAQPPVHQIG